MSADYEYVKLPNLYFLLQGIAIDVKRCADVIDATLVEFNRQTRIPDRIVAWNNRPPETRGRLSIPGHGTIQVIVEQKFHPHQGMSFLALVREDSKPAEQSFRMFIEMRSLTLDIPMRLELPLRACLKGCGRLRGTHAVYLHVLVGSDDAEYVYYGMTGRHWNVRFAEHTVAAATDEPRLFARKFGELIRARADERFGTPGDEVKLSAVVSSLCAVGLSRDAAMDTEEYLVDKYSLAGKHPRGLNMIPGGYEGMRALHRLSLARERQMIDTDEREAVLADYIRKNPSHAPRPGMIARWNDPEYAEAVICGREYRLTAPQVREVRYRASSGAPAAEIARAVGAVSIEQIRRVIAGRTYARIM